MTIFLACHGYLSNEEFGLDAMNILAAFGSREQAEEYLRKHPPHHSEIGAYEEIVEVTYTPAPPLPHPAPKFDIGG